MRNITVAKTAGFCFGVRRAVEMAKAAASENGIVWCIGPLIHNSAVVSQLERENVRTCADAESAPAGATVIIRAHGLSEADIELLKSKNCRIIDATCPDVAKIHDIVKRQSAFGHHIIIVGKANHPEVKAIASRCKSYRIFDESLDFDDLSMISLNSPVSVVCQTTLNTNYYLKIINILKNSCNTIDVFDTICTSTQKHQDEAARMSLESDVAIVIGDKSSSNTMSLYKLCKERCGNTYFIENAGQLERTMISGAQNIFVTAGASTPDQIIEEVYKAMSDETRDQAVSQSQGGESFEELLEQSLKTLHTGEKVSGVITQINATDISVDLGVKQAGYIPLSELSDDPTYVVADNIKVGDEIEAFVVRVNDVEGWIMLSKKRLDATKNWEQLEAAVESKQTVSGIVVDQNKGGVVALVMGIRVFIPASQTGLPRDASFDGLIKTTHKMRITEVNRSRRRVVGSIKAVMSEERKEAQGKVWETIEVGKRYTGTVKSFTSYGAFIDIGGVDGMAHISELAWSRVKHPSEVLKIGQEVEVTVIGLDTEKRKISLGYRKLDDNPWLKFVSTYKVGDEATVRIVKFMPFGAFAEIMPGVDGLIHISQIVADRRIGKPDEALKIGQEVNVKIVGIDNEKNKISLSIRALIDPNYEMPGQKPDSDELDDEPAVEPEAVTEETAE